MQPALQFGAEQAVDLAVGLAHLAPDGRELPGLVFQIGDGLVVGIFQRCVRRQFEESAKTCPFAVRLAHQILQEDKVMLDTPDVLTMDLHRAIPAARPVHGTAAEGIVVLKAQVDVGQRCQHVHAPPHHVDEAGVRRSSFDFGDVEEMVRGLLQPHGAFG